MWGVARVGVWRVRAPHLYHHIHCAVGQSWRASDKSCSVHNALCTPTQAPANAHQARVNVHGVG